MRHSDCKTHWCICEQHKLKWGPDQVYSWPFTDDSGPWSREKGEEFLRHNRFMLAGYQTVEPFFWPRPTPPTEPPTMLPEDKIVCDDQGNLIYAHGRLAKIAEEE